MWTTCIPMRNVDLPAMTVEQFSLNGARKLAGDATQSNSNNTNTATQQQKQ